MFRTCLDVKFISFRLLKSVSFRTVPIWLHHNIQPRTACSIYRSNGDLDYDDHHIIMIMMLIMIEDDDFWRWWHQEDDNFEGNFDGDDHHDEIIIKMIILMVIRVKMIILMVKMIFISIWIWWLDFGLNCFGLDWKSSVWPWKRVICVLFGFRLGHSSYINS